MDDYPDNNHNGIPDAFENIKPLRERLQFESDILADTLSLIPLPYTPYTNQANNQLRDNLKHATKILDGILNPPPETNGTIAIVCNHLAIKFLQPQSYASGFNERYRMVRHGIHMFICDERGHDNVSQIHVMSLSVFEAKYIK